MYIKIKSTTHNVYQVHEILLYTDRLQNTFPRGSQKDNNVHIKIKYRSMNHIMYQLRNQ